MNWPTFVLWTRSNNFQRRKEFVCWGKISIFWNEKKKLLTRWSIIRSKLTEVSILHSGWKIVSWRAITNRAINFPRNWVVRAKDLHAPTSRISCPRWWDSRVTTRTIIRADVQPAAFYLRIFFLLLFLFVFLHLCAGIPVERTEQWVDRQDSTRSACSNMLRQRCVTEEKFLRSFFYSN